MEKAKRGRPKGADNKDRVVYARLKPDTVKKLDKRAKVADRSRSWVIGEIVTDALKAE
jgi:predicted transcriptional regulator